MTVLPEVLQGNRLESLGDVFYQIRLTLALVHDFAVACGERGEDGVLDPYTWCTLETMTGDARKALERASDGLPAGLTNARLEAWAKENTLELARQLRELADQTERNHKAGYGPKPAAVPTQPEGA